MKKIFLIIVVTIFYFGTNAQEGNLGLSAGAGYYNGELNQRNVLYMPSPAFGLLYRHNFDERWSLRMGVNYFTLKGDDSRSENSYQTTRGHSFSKTVWDLGPQIEFNFKDYSKEKYTTDYFSPYISTGLLLIIVSDVEKPFEIAVPLAIGFKYAVTQKITAGLEWSYRWTNSDEVDGLRRDNLLSSTDPQRSYNPNSDWYSFIGAFFTFQVFKETSTCPSYSF